MVDETTVSGQVRVLVERLRAGDESARAELFSVATARLRHLAHRMLLGFPKLRALEETDDVLQNAALRVWKALEDIKPGNAREFFGLATLNIRRELIDLVRRHFGRRGEREPPQPEPADLPGSHTLEPSRPAVWTEFHEAVGRLPDDEREIVDLLWYQDLTQSDAADLLGIDKSTVKRRWRAARLKLASVLGDSLPDS